MQLALDGISKKVGAEDWLYEMSLAPHPRAVTVLLGATSAPMAEADCAST